MGFSGLIIYSMVKQNVEKNIETELQNSTLAILNTVKTAGSVSIKNHLRSAAEKDRDFVQYLYDQQAKGEINRQEALDRAIDMILYQKIGKNGYACILDGSGKVFKHPKKSLEGLDISDHKFVQEMMAKKNGYIEYEWKNPEDKTARPKAMYITYFEPWNWMITISSYRNEFSKLVNIDDVKESITGLKFGKTGYSFVLDTQGNVIIHPRLAGMNIGSSKDASFDFLKTMMVEKNGKMVYSWKDDQNGRPRKKLVIFNYIPEYEWIVASSSYLDEFFLPLYTIRTVIVLVCAAALIFFVPITFILSSSITRPLHELMSKFDQDIIQGFSNRRLKHKSRDEIGQLTVYYNLFMEKLETYDQDIQDQIRERRMVQEALEESEEKYRSVMEATPDPVVVYDMKGRVAYMNPAFTSVFGYSLEESLGQNMDHFIPNQYQHPARQNIKTILAGRILPKTESQRISKTGEYIDVAIRGAVYLNRDGQPAGSVITHQDITLVKRLEKAVMETGEKERQKIGNDLHDDLCPHLIGIEGLTKVLKRKLASSPDPDGVLADKVISLIKEAIQKTRLMAQGLCPAYFNHSLESALEKLADRTRIRHQIDCRFEPAADICIENSTVNTNIYHIVQEAVQNAIRHGKAGIIVIRVRNENGLCIIEVQDNGIGMDLSLHNQGMGLHIMEYRAGLINANLTIRSDTGTCITLILPPSIPGKVS